MASARDDSGDDHRGCPMGGGGCPMGQGQGAAATPDGAAPLHYSNYLMIDRLLSCQQLISARDGAIHDEHLFIITHQAYELWFKQSIVEIDSIIGLFADGRLDGKKSFLVGERLDRVIKILELIRGHFGILETMTPMSFLEFRSYLSPASGFQSLQFRMLENKFGVREAARVKYANESYEKQIVAKEDIDQLQKSKLQESLFDVVERWLEQLLDDSSVKFGGPFIAKFNEAVKRLLEDQPGGCAIIPEEAEYEEARKKELLAPNSERRVSHKAFHGALMVYLYREDPAFTQFHRILVQLLEADVQIAKWRYHHVLMVQRMIGSKAGTGGSSGYLYLRSTVSDKYRVFVGLTHLSTYIIPAKYLPPLTQAAQ